MTDDAVPPIPYTWTGEAFEPLPRFRKTCDQYLVVGQVYEMGEVARRGMARHRAFFASVGEAYKNLPEAYGDFFKSADHLRKWCLIKAGYCTTESFVLATKDEADKFAAYFRKHSAGTEFRVYDVNQRTVTVYTAMSQQVLRKGKGMDNETFKASVRAVTQQLDLMLGVKPGTTERQRESA